ncbi:Fur family ferric uptake transcriptional regulator [Chryseobacterium defluvii]|uniref:Fur family ferric uptake transcriptional regulator n=1 Tax=Chryseobacterium defluvii TaxID=160396 RepID=A0A840KH28_9FLAO|nr:transcriptional repressor [Chryseobacterium defluvii]MBB4806202.1 Fur family ferric uptake transcriptional regulator [Chryseobacterium defluvii]
MAKRNTKAKQLILDSLKNTRSAISQEVLQKELGETVDRATIYRVLNSFCEDGIIHKILSDDGKYYFAVCMNCSEKAHKHNHFHFRCLQCGKIECLPNEIEVKLPEGYRSVNFNGFISGYCSGCS